MFYKGLPRSTTPRRHSTRPAGFRAIFPLSNSLCWSSYSLGCVILKYIFVSQQGGKGGPGVTAVYKLPRYWTQLHLKQQGSEPQGYSKKVR